MSGLKVCSDKEHSVQILHRGEAFFFSSAQDISLTVVYPCVLDPFLNMDVSLICYMEIILLIELICDKKGSDKGHHSNEILRKFGLI